MSTLVRLGVFCFKIQRKESQFEQRINQCRRKTGTTVHPGASVKASSMADVPLLEVDWLWKPYIPFGKVTIIQGNPGEGKTILALRLASACSRGKAFHEMEPQVYRGKFLEDERQEVM